jgi:RHS repeat-associated protein
MVWDEDGRLQSVTDNNGQPTTFKYDGDTNRVVKKGAGGETLYINPWYVAALGRNSKQVFAGGTRIATKLEISPTGEGYGPGAKNLKEVSQYFYHQDHLGSTGFATDATGEVWQHLEYFPFGETWVNEVSDDLRVRYRFTGQEFDQETRLYYHGARYYDPKTSVWQNPDPALGKLLNTKKTGPGLPNLANDWRPDTVGLGLGGMFNPRNLNGFAYAHQSPLQISDPDGNTPAVAIAGCFNPVGAVVCGGALVVGGIWLYGTESGRKARQNLSQAVSATAGSISEMTGSRDDAEAKPVPIPLTKTDTAGDGSVTLHHGTDLESVQNIMAGGFNMREARELGGGDLLWTTRDPATAAIFAKANPKLTGHGAVISFTLTDSTIQRLQAGGLLSIEGNVYKFKPGAMAVVNAAPRIVTPVP